MRGGRDGGRRGGGGEAENGAGGFNPALYAKHSPGVQQSLRNWHQDTAKLDVDLVEQVVAHICAHEPEGAILVFMTGWDDISKLYDRLKSNRITGNTGKVSGRDGGPEAARRQGAARADTRDHLPLTCTRPQVALMPLHGSMPTANQQQIFNRPPRGVRKVVIATNIAETSITIDDIVYVVDGGKAKEKTYDAVNKLSCLLPAWVSQASARQRRGRAGRVQNGVCYHLYPKVMHDGEFVEHQLPELLRTPLEELCLSIKSLRLGRIEDFLAKALEPPDALAIKNAIDLLSE